MSAKLLENKVAVITGASSGIGMATARLFVENGARVVVVARREKPLVQLVESLQQAGGEALALPADVTQLDACKQTIEQTISAFGQLDMLINAAGIIANGTIETTEPAAWHQMMDINLNSVFQLTQLAVPHLARTKGTIVNVSSVTGLRAFPNVLAYCVSKAGLDQMTRCIALELAPKGIRVNAINPGVVVTNLHKTSGMDETKYQAFLEHSKTTHPLGRVGNADEIAESILFLASEKSGWITGETLSIDGGRHLTCAR
ncbi:MAG: glucose 1-dehydrogenase [Deferribacteres bacterium]|nr:glucose 1-dehydrogenase [candidate division KSB1 bacterium]MCB9511551.1 glucose 1-dehydrogenase [Deferribacteres bacterium]